MQFLVYAKDSTDPDAADRRRRSKPAHQVIIERLKREGSFRAGGHTLDDNEKISGSAVFLEFASRAELDAYLNEEPYVANKVWASIEVVRVNLG